MIELSMITIATTLGILGCIFVSYNQPIIANLLWIVGNPLMLYHNLKAGETEQARMWVVYTVIAAFGVFNNRKTIFKFIKNKIFGKTKTY